LRFAFLLLAAGSLAGEPFSHKRHAAMKLKCTACHATAESAAQASFPDLAKCQTCHPEMAALPARSPRLYRVKDFVTFNHQRHAEAKAPCATCHGEVYTMEPLKVERPVTMVACVACHKERKASIACNLCHELGQ
jgi:hypothetical protein